MPIIKHFNSPGTKTNFYIPDIKDNIKYRPPGYYEDVMSRGEIQGDYLILDESEAIYLIDKYQEKSPVIDILASDTHIWGPKLWKELHDRTNNYDGKDVRGEFRWIEKCFKFWVPCGKCKTHFIQLLKDNPPKLNSRASYQKWAIDIHNKVNENLDKPIYSIPDHIIEQLKKEEEQEIAAKLEIQKQYVETQKRNKEIELQSKETTQNESGNADNSPQEYPGVFAMAKNFGTSMVKWAKSGFKTVDEQSIYDARLEICKSCPEWDSNALGGTGRCKICGCSTKAKLRLATESCPKNLWGPVIEEN